jgi:hypothetical protein
MPDLHIKAERRLCRRYIKEVEVWASTSEPFIRLSDLW